MNLIIVRHAKSLHDDYVQKDSERHLCARGYKDAADSADWCLSSGLKPDLMVSSPAIRAFSTAMIFANIFSYKTDGILLDAAIYEAGVRQLLYVLEALPQGSRTVMLFGHNPGCTELINYLCGPVCSHLPTSGVAFLVCDSIKGKKYQKGTCLMKAFYSGHKPD